MDNIMPHQYKTIGITIMSFFMLSCGEVSEDAAHIQLGTGNVLYVLNDTQYQVPLVVHVTDIDGNAIPDAEVKISVVPVAYHKGSYVWLDINNAVTLIEADAVKWSSLTSVICPAEDTNYDGVWTVAKDINGNGVLDPSNVATVDAHPTSTPTIDLTTNTITTGNSGYGYFSLVYPEYVANWVSVKIKATTKVHGTERASTIDNYLLLSTLTEMQATSVAPPGGLSFSPYGVANVCTDPN